MLTYKYIKRKCVRTVYTTEAINSKIHNDCDFTVVVRSEVDDDVMNTVDTGHFHPPGGCLFVQ